MQVLVGSSDYPHVGGLFTLCTDRTVSSFLYGTKEHLLHFHSQVTHLVKKQRTALGFLKISGSVAVRTRERSLDMTEKSGWGKCRSK